MGDDCRSTHVSAKAQEDHLTHKRDDGLSTHSPSTPMQVGPCTSDFPEFPVQEGKAQQLLGFCTHNSLTKIK
jgi:hypothetical protein